MHIGWVGLSVWILKILKCMMEVRVGISYLYHKTPREFRRGQQINYLEELILSIRHWVFQV